jgi:hypothetical protein
MPLRRCTGLYGSTTLIEHDPMLATHTDVLCVPYGTEGASAGLYDRGRKLVTAAASFRAAPDPVAAEAPVTPLDATRFEHAPDDVSYLFLGALTGHFGHFILSSMARLWALRFAPDPRRRYVILNAGPVEAVFALPFLRDILGQLGLGPSNVVCFDAPTRLRRIVVPSPAIEEQNFSHRVFAGLCNRVGALLTASLPTLADDAPVFLSKMRLQGGVSRLGNEAAFCERLERRGVRIVIPEQLGFAEQVRLFRDAPVITGIAGSAMHTAVFAPGRVTLALSFTPTPLSNQRLLDQANGGLGLAFHPEGDLVAEPAQPGFHHVFRLRDPVRTADEFLAEIEATLRPAIAARRRAAGDDGATPDSDDPVAGRVLFEHVFSREPPILTAGEDGWSEPEDSHVWTLGPQSTLTLPRPDTVRPLRLELVLGTTLLPPHLRSRPLAVSVNGVKVRRFTVDRTALYACTLPESCLAGPALALRFDHPVTVSPRDLGLNADIRPISIAFNAVRLRELDSP